MIVDLVGRRGVRAYRRALAKGGHAVLVGGSFRKLFQAVTLGPLSARFGGKRVSVLAHKPRRADLIELNEMVDSGKVAPVVDRIYPLAEVPDAVRRIAAGESVGKLVISV